jgi:hypothetical protein
MPTFCRHNRFIERCPICSRTLPGNASTGSSESRARSRGRTRSDGERATRTSARGQTVRVRREGRAADDGYRCELVPGLRASADAMRLAEELAFSSGRLAALVTDAPGLYGEIRALAGHDLERATWAGFLTAYLGPLENASDGASADTPDPFAGIRCALTASPGELPDLADVPLGPRTSHDPARGVATLLAYRQWVVRSGGEGANGQELAFTGDPDWSAQRRFERIFERIALPGFTRAGRYELLVLLGRLGLYELTPDALHLSSARSAAPDEATTTAAKRVFGIGDPLLLERRAVALAEAVEVPIEALDLALANWLGPERATLGFPAETSDDGAFERSGEALGL